MASPAQNNTVPFHKYPKIQAGHLRSDLDLTTEELTQLLALTEQVKRNPSRFRNALTGEYLSLLFEKPSLRTRLTFELAIKQLGGDCIASTGRIDEREPVKDVARNLDRWTGCIVARTFLQDTVDELARWSRVPVINALSNLYHPCQALADVFTLKERFGNLQGLKLAFVGDGNNVVHSLMLTAARLGVHVSVSTPQGYTPNAGVMETALELAAESGGRVQVAGSPEEAVKGAHAVYTDVWASMGHEKEAEQRKRDFASHQVHEGLMALARQESIFMHCLPARRGQETTDTVMESPQSVVFDQAENRLHAQKALLLMLLG